MPDVVLVDDDDDYREVLSADLADRGFSVSCFADGPSFLEAMSKGDRGGGSAARLGPAGDVGVRAAGRAARARDRTAGRLPDRILPGRAGAAGAGSRRRRLRRQGPRHGGAGPPAARDHRGAAPGPRARGGPSRASRRAGFVSFHGARPVAAARYRLDHHGIQDRDAAGVAQGTAADLPRHLRHGPLCWLRRRQRRARATTRMSARS